MFKSARWRSEKNKIKAVFKLQFHATQLPEVGGDALIMSLIPADIGKPTLRLEKAAIRDGSCYWDNPVQETVKFFQEPKTGKIHEKIYNLVVSRGSSKASFVGEASIDFASYAEATKISSVSLPLKNAKADAILHVLIQRLQENMEEREAEENEKTNIYTDRSLKAQFSAGDTDGNIKSNSTEDEPINLENSHIDEANTNYRASSGSDLTLSSSGSSSELIIPIEFGSKDHVSVLNKATSNDSGTFQEDQLRSQWEWLGGSAPEVSTDDSSISPREALLRESREGASDIIIEKLKSELASLSRQAELSGLELQTLRKQIVKESKRGQDLLNEVHSLKEERDVLKDKCEKLNSFQKRMDEVKIKNKLKFEGGEWDPLVLLEELRQELYYEKDLNDNLRLQLQKTQESNSELILAVRDLDEMLEQKSKELLSATSKKNEVLRENDFKSETEDDEEQKALEELVKEHTDAKEAHALEQKVMDLYSALEVCQRDKDDLEAQMEQISLDYEILKQENHDILHKLEQSQLQEQLKMQYECSSPYTIIELETHIENLESELKKQLKELSNSSDMIAKLENYVKNLEEEMEKKVQGFETDFEMITRSKVEQEQRAIRAEEALRKMRWQNVNTAERLQEEFTKLSVQMASTFEENEKVAMKALTEASELRLQKKYLEEMVEKNKEEVQLIKDQYEAKLCELSNEISLKVNQIEQLELGKKNGEKTQSGLLEEIVMLREGIKKLETENNNLSDGLEGREILEREFELMKKSMKETDIRLQRAKMKRNEMENVIELLRKEVDKSMEEVNALRSLKDEKESMVEVLETEVQTLKSECDQLKRSLFEDGFEKEKLRKQVSQLKGDLKKKEDSFSNLEKKLKDGTKITSRNNKSVGPPRGPKEVTNLKDKIKLLEGQIKLKEAALENSTNTFLEKEKDLHNKIEELETTLEELNHNSVSFCEHEIQKVAKGSEDIIMLGSRNGTSSNKEGDLDELCNEISSLRERNKAMEGELKEMQERYSEISLKFAEVEGERQQLVMTVRNLKNAKRS